MNARTGWPIRAACPVRLGVPWLTGVFFLAVRSGIAIIGTVGLPARYGGFETLADELVKSAQAAGASGQFTVYCSARQSGRDRPVTHHGARLRYLPLGANGLQSVAYDALSLLDAARRRHDAVLVLGVSGAIALPAVRLLTGLRVIVHVDGIEWQRPKWRGAARAFLRLSERIAVRWGHEVIADNVEIARYIRRRYDRDSALIAYGSDADATVAAGDISDLGLPAGYALTIARIEPENHVAMILEAFAKVPDQPLVVVGNWHATAHGRDLRARYAHLPNLHLIDAEYDPARLRALRRGARFYVHGHSAGGTNPSLVEMMAYGIPIAAFACAFNRETTHGAASFFDSARSLRDLIPALADPRLADGMGADLAALAHRHYRWSDVTAAYFRLLGM